MSFAIYGINLSLTQRTQKILVLPPDIQNFEILMTQCWKFKVEIPQICTHRNTGHTQHKKQDIIT
jgi:hypothetical protein